MPLLGLGGSYEGGRAPHLSTNHEGGQAIPAKVFVGNLNYYTTESELTDLLSEAGQIIDVYMPADKHTGKPRGFAFVEFSSEDEASQCMEKFNEHDLGGRRLNIKIAEDRPRPSPGFRGGGFRDGPGGGGGPRGAASKPPSRPKGSRRGKRGKKRSL